MRFWSTNSFVYVVHPQANGQVESENKVILKRLKNKIDDAKVLWDELFHKILWPYHTTPYSTAKETPFAMVYGAYSIMPIEIDTASWKCSKFYQEVNKVGLECVVNLIDELREVAYVREFSTKHRAAKR